jgi:hypothetical protein
MHGATPTGQPHHTEMWGHCSSHFSPRVRNLLHSLTGGAASTRGSSPSFICYGAVAAMEPVTISYILPAGHPSFGVYKRMPGTPLSLPNCLHIRVHEETVIVVEREGRSSHRRRPVRSLPAGFHGGVKENRPNLGNMFGGLPTVGDRWSAGKFLAVDLPPPSNHIASWSSHLGTFRRLGIPLSGSAWSYFLFASCFS